MKVLVFGGHGLIGRELTEVLSDLGAEVLAPSRSNCDISKAGVASAAVASIAPDAVVNLAAQTDVDRCEIHSSDAWDVNSYGAMSVAVACAKVKRKPYLIHVSTDYVFDGGASTPYLPDHGPNPLSLYGRTKASGESAVLDLASVGGGSLVLRTSWVYGRAKPSFMDSVLRRMTAEGGPIEVCNDQISLPTRALDLAKWLAEAVAVKPTGIMHFSGGGEPVSRHDWARFFVDFARKVTGNASYDPSRVVGVSTSSLPLRAARRPDFSALNTDSAMGAIPFGPLWSTATEAHVSWLASGDTYEG